MPVKTVSHTHGNHLQSRPSVSKRPTLAGMILWLPPKEELKVDLGLEDGCYNHPIVVLSPKISDGKVVILILTSFNGVDLSMKHAHNTRARVAHLPIEPCSPHPDNGILLSLEGDMFLHKNSYVKTENWYTISFLALRSYDRSGESFVLTKESYRVLVNYVNFIPVVSRTTNPLPNDHERPLRLPTNNSRYAQYSQPDPRPNPGSYGNDGLDVWVAQAIEVAKGVAKSAWDWIRGSTGL